MKRAEKERIAEQEEFEKTYILEAFADIRASLDSDTAALEAHAKAYIAMLRLKERWGTAFVGRIYNWLTGENGPPQCAHGDTLRKRIGSKVYSFLQQQPIPRPTMSLEEYQGMWNLYIHPELCESVSREGQFYVEEGPLFLVTRLTPDATLHVYPMAGPWKLCDSYVGALKTKKSHINKMMAKLGEILENTEKEIRKEEVSGAK